MEGWTIFVRTWGMYSEEGSMVVLRCVLSNSTKTYHYITGYRKTLQKPWVLCLPERLHAMVAFDVLKRVEHIIFKTELEKGCKRWKRSLPNISKDVVSRQKGYQKVKYTDGQVRTIAP